MQEVAAATTETLSEPDAVNPIERYTYNYSTSKNFSIHSEDQYVLLDGATMLIAPKEVRIDRGDGCRLVLSRGGVLKFLYQAPNITETMVNLAHYMTVAMRSNDTILQEHGLQDVAPSHRVAGTVNHDQIYVAVHWAWLTLPGLLVVLVVFLQVATIIETQRHKVGVWKDSPLALLLHAQLKSRAEPKDVDARTADQIEKEANGLEAVLVQDAEGEHPTKEMKRTVLISTKSTHQKGNIPR